VFPRNFHEGREGARIDRGKSHNFKEESEENDAETSVSEQNENETKGIRELAVGK